MALITRTATWTPASTLRPRVYTSWDELAELRAAWEHLLQESTGPTIFSTQEWLGAWWKAFSAGKQLLTITFSNSRGELVGVAPFYLDEVNGRYYGRLRRLRLVGDGTVDSDNLDLIVRTGQEEVCAKAVLDWLASESVWDLCELNTLPANSPNTRPMLRLLDTMKWVQGVYEHPNSAVVLPENWDAYLGQLSKEQAYGIERYTRRLRRHYAVAIYKCVREEELPGYLDVLFDLHQKRWTGRGLPGTFSSQERRQFYTDMSRAFLRRGWLEFWLLELDGMIVAAQFAFRYGDTVYQLQEGLDPAHYTDRAGQVLRAHIIKQLIADGVHRYDFLRGDQEHKRNWGALPGSYTYIHFAKPFTRAGLYIPWRDRIETGRRWLEANAPAPAYSLVRDIYRRIQ